jgi:hypothetical protein
VTKIITGEYSPYYSQDNNKRRPMRACGRTSAINALAALGVPFPESDYQPEDDLDLFIENDPKCQALYATKPADMRAKNPISEWQDILALGVNRWIGKTVAHFNEYASTQSVIDHIVKKGVCLVTGFFPAEHGKVLEHTVALIGLEYDVSPTPYNVFRYWIRDPHGDHRTLYKNKNGAHVDFMPLEFKSILKAPNTDRKWCIFIEKV